MIFAEEYTTEVKINLDITGKEERKTMITGEAFAIGDIIQKLIDKLEDCRVTR